MPPKKGTSSRSRRTKIIEPIKRGQDGYENPDMERIEEFSVEGLAKHVGLEHCSYRHGYDGERADVPFRSIHEFSSICKVFRFNC